MEFIIQVLIVTVILASNIIGPFIIFTLKDKLMLKY